MSLMHQSYLNLVLSCPEHMPFQRTLFCGSPAVTKWGKITKLVIIMRKYMHAYEGIWEQGLSVVSFWRFERSMAEVPKQLSLVKAPSTCECIVFGNGWLWFKSEQEVWPAWFQWRLMTASESSGRSKPPLIVRAGLIMWWGELMLKQPWEGCLMTRL